MNLQSLQTSQRKIPTNTKSNGYSKHGEIQRIVIISLNGRDIQTPKTPGNQPKISRTARRCLNSFIPKERIPINLLSTVQRLDTEFGIQGTNQSRIQILGRSRKDPRGLLKLFRFLTFHTFQLFDVVDTTRNRTHHFLKPQFLLFSQATHLGARLFEFFLGSFQLGLSFLVLGTDTTQLLRGKRIHIAVRPVQTNALITTGRVHVGRLAILEALISAKGTSGHIN
ncbi:hypothetical protein J3459_022514 [Metarhizium acridum]|nr:hypothetical protein J3459_022514 [Metarhizium acridum]